MELNKIYKGDCVELLKQIDFEVDLIIADPPYVISKESNFHTMPDRKNQRTGTNFGEWDKEFDNNEWIELAYQKLKKGGSIIIFNDFKKATKIYNIATEAGFEYKDTLIWHKTNPMPRNRDRRYIPNIEMIQWYVKKGSKWTFNRQNEKYESCILSFPSESGGGFKRYHPTQKPVKLIEYLLLIHSNPNDIILDPFIGSGTTALACINKNRRYIGFEINQKYIEITNKRINTMIK
jgi:DNA modification methylase